MSTTRVQHIAVVGCVHGHLQEMYASIQNYEKANGKIDFVICTGDMQTLRTKEDLAFLKCPEKYRKMGDFEKYFCGTARAPYPTIFVGGNHEASNSLLNMHNGGFAATNIYYLGAVGTVQMNGIRVCGMSGIYKEYDQNLPFTYPPNIRDCVNLFHTRRMEVEKLKSITRADIVVSHDWPQGIVAKGNYAQLYKNKPHIQNDGFALGSPLGAEVLAKIHPSYWISGHMHCGYEAVDENTKFIALAKVGYNDSVSGIRINGGDDSGLRYDPDWICTQVITWPCYTNMNTFPSSLESIRNCLSERNPMIEAKIQAEWEKIVGWNIVDLGLTSEQQFNWFREKLRQVYSKVFPTQGGIEEIDF
ncbi:Lariat debranching enzyme [Entamoeba marina]